MLRKRVSNITRSLAIIAACMLGANSIAATHAQKHMAGDTKYFKDWAAGCDNTLSCQAIAMQPEGNSDDYLTLSLTRSAGKARATMIEVTGMDTDVSKYRIYADKRLVISGTLKGVNDSIALSAADSARLLKTMPSGQELRVTDNADKLLGRISLNGSSAALRYLDSMQKRGNSPSPVITANRIGKDGRIPETADLVILAENSLCVKEREGVTEDSAFSLGGEGDKARALALISCGNGAYNFSSAAFVGTRSKEGKWTFAPAKFDDAKLDNEGTDKEQKLLTNATWDAGAQSLNSYHKGRALADCGMTEEYVWDGAMFRLTRAEQMKECKGAPVWITIWQAAVKFTG